MRRKHNTWRTRTNDKTVATNGRKYPMFMRDDDDPLIANLA